MHQNLIMMGKITTIFTYILLSITIIPAVSPQNVLKIYQQSLGAKIYKLYYGQKFNWGDAFVACKADRSDLLSVDSLSELVFIRQFINNAGFGNATGEYFWTSGSNMYYNEDHHIWMSNGREILKAIWSENQPDNLNGNDEHCNHLWFRNGAFSLNDNRCSLLINFICESESCDL